tara:strand:+ start:602 stop:721 length:120 start_codon:yes stop_codon:yes gene_type:complete
MKRRQYKKIMKMFSHIKSVRNLTEKEKEDELELEFHDSS